MNPLIASVWAGVPKDKLSDPKAIEHKLETIETTKQLQEMLADVPKADKSVFKNIISLCKRAKTKASALQDAQLGIIGPFIKELFTDEHGTAYASIKTNDHVEHWPVMSLHFSDFVLKVHFDKTGQMPSELTVKNIIRLCSAKAKFEGRQNVETHLRAAKVGDSVYLDLCNPEWESLKISPDAIETVDEPPVIFRRYGHMKPLKVDLNAEIDDFELIWKYAHITDDDRLLFKVSRVLDFIPNIPRAIDVIHGPQGSCKSTTMKISRLIVDPSSMKSLSLPDKLDELIRKCNHHYICAFDNVRKLKPAQSDICCRVTTGDASAKRALYTDDSDFIITKIRKLMFNGINVAGEEPDFLDRATTYHLTRLDAEHRKEEKPLWAAFRKDQPKITGATLKILQKTLSTYPEVKLSRLPRMADFCRWGESASRAMGNPENAFTQDYWAKIGKLNTEALESNPIGVAITHLMNEQNDWEGTVSELKDRLEEIADKNQIKTDHRAGWPQSPNYLRRKIETIKSNLQDEGIMYNADKRQNKGRIIHLWYSTVTTDIRAPDSENVPSPTDTTDTLPSPGVDGDDTVSVESGVPSQPPIANIPQSVDSVGKNGKESRSLSGVDAANLIMNLVKQNEKLGGVLTLDKTIFDLEQAWPSHTEDWGDEIAKLQAHGKLFHSREEGLKTL